jgi:hypothetical protein
MFNLHTFFRLETPAEIAARVKAEETCDIGAVSTELMVLAIVPASLVAISLYIIGVLAVAGL